MQVVADARGRVIDRGRSYLYQNVWDFFGRRRHTEVTLDFARQSGRALAVKCQLPEDAVRLWREIPSHTLLVRLPDEQGQFLVSTEDTAPNVTDEQHLKALICSLLSGGPPGPQWGDPPPASQFVWAMCLRMAVSREAALALTKSKPTYAIHTLAGTVLREKVGERLSVAEILLRAHEDTLRKHRNPKDPNLRVRTTKMDAELHAYAVIAKTFAEEPLPAWYTRYATGKLEPAPPSPLPYLKATAHIDLSNKLTLDALCIAHAKYARDATNGVAELKYIAEGTDNVVFGIDKERILRVRNVPRNDRVNHEAGVEKSIWLALEGQGVIPKIFAEPYVVLGQIEHSAVVMQRFDSNLGNLKPGFIVNFSAVEDTLVELYARLSTAAKCVDTKPENVVVGRFPRRGSSDGTTLALIDTDGLRCAMSRLSEGVPWDAYVGPICLADLDYALSVAYEQTSPKADSPLLFSAICLFVFHVRDSYANLDTMKPTRYVRTRALLKKYFETVWTMMLAYDNRKSPSQTAMYMISHYGQLKPGDEKEGARRLLFQLQRATKNGDEHARAYWSGVGRLIDDLGADLVANRQEESALGKKIRELALARYNRVDEARLKAHIVLAQRRFDEKRGVIEPLIRAGTYSLGDERREFYIRNACSVDRLTAEAFVLVILDSAREAQPVVLYTPPEGDPREEQGSEPEPQQGPQGPSESCASAIAALLASAPSTRLRAEPELELLQPLTGGFLR
jgi:hypothetical protein